MLHYKLSANLHTFQTEVSSIHIGIPQKQKRHAIFPKANSIHANQLAAPTFLFLTPSSLQSIPLASTSSLFALGCQVDLGPIPSISNLPCALSALDNGFPAPTPQVS